MLNTILLTGSRGRGGSGGGISSSSAGLQVFLERGSGRDGFTGILVHNGVGVTGIGHTSGSNVLVEGSGAAELGSGGERRSGGNKGREGDELHIGYASEVRLAIIMSGGSVEEDIKNKKIKDCTNGGNPKD